ncbi:Retrovirus-related Pol polyprotein from transposon TNT 1-94 [Gossypium australe]|uniref:Retrovirus-related Pol polyprotein from transposon TNT 1-94 n=1 Tax=Gossypium australe TaxID=47621 RepID=A0A5B6W873_9ROSI|nr:Retrovirus-related Pol polyprotein from transposon TNT 1-94 [Gossypium australe]
MILVKLPIKTFLNTTLALRLLKYALAILIDSRFLEYKPTKISMFIACLLYLTSTRPNISFLAQQLSKFIDKPTIIHIQVAYRILHYLKGCLIQGDQSLTAKNQSIVSHSSLEAEYCALTSTTHEIKWLHYIL